MYGLNEYIFRIISCLVLNQAFEYALFGNDTAFESNTKCFLK